MGVVSGINTVTDGLIFYVDPTNANTYSGVGTTAYNLIPGGINNFSLNNGLSYDLDKSGSFYFDGSNDYVGLGSTTIFNSTAFTVSFWIKPTAYNGTVCSGAVSNGQYTIFGTSSTYQGYSSTFSGAIQTGGSSNSVATVNQSNFSINKWYHYVAVYDSAGTGNSTKFKIYIDGAIKSLTFDATMPSAPFAANQESRLGFGPGAPGYPYYNGNIGLVQIHSRALSSTEIVQNYNATKARFNTTENIVTNGLVLNVDAGKSASYPGTGTTIYDLSGSGFTGTLVSSPTFSTLNGGSLVFNGSSYITRSSALNAGQNFSVTAWIYPTALSGGGRNAVIGNAYPFLTDNGWYFCISNNNFGTFQSLMISLGQDNCIKISNSYVFQLNSWTHIAVTVSGGGASIKLYANGVETSYGFSGGSARTLVYTNNEFNIGVRYSASEKFVGSISQVQIYNTTLTTQEILQNYNATKSRYINVLPPVNDSLVLNLDAGNRASYAGTGTTWYDLSGRGNNFSLLNGVVFAGSGTTTYMSFDGTNDRATFTGGVNLGTSHTVSVMFKPNDAGMNAVIFGDIGFNNTGYAFYVNGNTAYYAAGNTFQSISFTNSTNWMYLTVVRNGTSLTFYKNETSLGSVTLSLDSLLKVSSLGSYYAGDYSYNGSISIATCYTRALSASEVLQNFNSVRSRYNI